VALGALQNNTSLSEALPMKRILLIPTRTSDGRHLIFRAALVSPVRQLLARARHAFAV
jgi:hypothetical protein